MEYRKYCSFRARVSGVRRERVSRSRASRDIQPNLALCQVLSNPHTPVVLANAPFTQCCARTDSPAAPGASPHLCSSTLPSTSPLIKSSGWHDSRRARNAISRSTTRIHPLLLSSLDPPTGEGSPCANYPALGGSDPNMDQATSSIRRDSTFSR